MLCSAGCNAMAQWDLTRAVPRKVREMSLFTGDIQGLAAGGGRVFSCGADGSIRSWEVGKKGELSEGAARDKAHKERVSAILYHSVRPNSDPYNWNITPYIPQSLVRIQ